MRSGTDPRPSVVRRRRRPSRFGGIAKAFRVLIWAPRNLAYLLRTIFSKKVLKRNFDFLPLKFFMGVQSQNWLIFAHFWRFSAHNSVAFPNGTLIFSKMNLLGRCHHLAKSKFQNFKFGRFGGDLKFQNFGSNFFFFHFLGLKLHETCRKLKISKKIFFWFWPIYLTSGLRKFSALITKFLLRT